MESMPTVVARVTGAEGTATCPTAGLVVVSGACGTVLAVISLFTRHYSAVFLALVLLAGMAFWTWLRPFTRSAQERFQGHVSAGQWVILEDYHYFKTVTAVLARFDNHAADPGPMVALGLANGSVLEQLPNEPVAVVELFDPWAKRRHESAMDEVSSLDELLEVVVQAFDSRAPDGKHEWIEVEPEQLGSRGFKVGKRFRLIDVKEPRGRSPRVRCTGAGEVWVLSVLRERGVELIEGARRPDPDRAITLNINRSNVGVLNLGAVLGRIEVHLNQLDTSVPQLAEVQQALKALTEGVAGDAVLSDQQKQELLQALDSLAEAANQPEPKRPSGLVRPALRGISETIGMSAALTTLWDVWSQPLAQFFGIS